MCVNQARLDRRHRRRIFKRTWRNEIQYDTQPEEVSDAFVGEQIANEYIALPASAEPTHDATEVDPVIVEVGRMYVVRDGLPFGLHIISREDLRSSRIAAA
jgi:hypothetical protein